MHMKPLSDWVLLKVLESKEKKGGIVLPETARETKIQEAKVIAVGEGKDREPQVKVGDKVLFGRYSGVEVALKDEEYLMVKEEHILGIIN